MLFHEEREEKKAKPENCVQHVHTYNLLCVYIEYKNQKKAEKKKI
jgi:hypothetical protein